MDKMRLLWYNYGVAMLFSDMLFVIHGQPGGHFSIQSLGLLGNDPSQDSMFTLAVVMGILGGFTYLIAFVVMQRSIVTCGPGIGTIFAKLGIMSTAVITSPLWNEKLNTPNIIGIVLTAIALFLFHKGDVVFNNILLVCFALSGMNEILKKVYTFYGDMRYQYMYYAIVFTICFLLSCCIVFFRKEKHVIKKDEALLGSVLGLVNMIASQTVLIGLSLMPTGVFFTCQAGAVICLTSIIGVLRYKEPLTKTKVVGLVITLCSLVLMNM